jgi:hypothetical protein
MINYEKARADLVEQSDKKYSSLNGDRKVTVPFALRQQLAGPAPLS